MNRSMASRMAERAWEQLSSHSPDDATASKIKARCQDFPRCVRQNGLALAVTFFLAKKGDDQYDTYLHWLAQNLAAEAVVTGQGPAERLIENAVLSVGPAEYRALTGIVMDAALWYKRLAEARWPSV